LVLVAGVDFYRVNYCGWDWFAPVGRTPAPGALAERLDAESIEG